MDRLEMMFDLQYKLQDRLGTWKKIDNNEYNPPPVMLQQFTNQMILALVEESIEIMRETAYKNPDFVPFGWKKGQGYNREGMLDEIVDLWHFMMNLCLAHGFTANDFYRAYEKKNHVNHKRQDNGY
jgi:dimeric dUTPase (all-alpha-NTP-PPase superfamily)